MESSRNDDALSYLSASANGEIFEIVISGELSVDIIVSLKDKINEMAITQKVKRMLVDTRGARADIGYPETYLIAMKTPPYFDNIPTAVVHSPENSHLARFHEDLMNKNGLPMKFFTDIDKARNWLKKYKRKIPFGPFH